MPTPTLTQSLLIALIQAILVVIFIFVVVPLTIFAERKVLGHIQDRLGSTRIAGHLTGLTGWMNRGMWKMGRCPCSPTGAGCLAWWAISSRCSSRKTSSRRNPTSSCSGSHRP